MSKDFGVHFPPTQEWMTLLLVELNPGYQIGRNNCRGGKMACDPDRRCGAHGTPGGYARVLIGIVCGYNVCLREKKKEAAAKTEE